MKRDVEKQLQNWKKQTSRMPILLRGARQVGKTYLVEKFGQNHFQNLVNINFELQPEFCQCFENLDPVNITNLISSIAGQPILPGETLLFLDEIQECLNAIASLRYFKEKMPNLHVIGAGSLLEFVLNDENFRMPVGRVQYLYLKPISFKEYLVASGNEQLVICLEQATVNKGVQQPIHKKLLSLLREYLVLGGMPAVIKEYLANKNFTQCQNIQIALLNTFRNDFGKYAKKTNHIHLQKLYEKAPGLIGQHFKYVKIDPDMLSRDIKTAMNLLSDAGIINIIYSTAASGLPLNALINEKKFKMIFLDVGLVKRTSQLGADILLKEDLLLINQGALAEQFVGQEILAYADPFEASQLFFWAREQRGSMAEVDYVINVDSLIVPVEVKSGATGRLKSLRIFMAEKKLNLGVRISQHALGLENGILSVPLYMINEIPRLVRDIAK